MRKVIIVIIVMILFVMVALNAGQSTTSTELLLSESKARRNIESIVSSIESLGDAAFKGVEIQVDGFRGIVEQPPSSATKYLERYKIKDENLVVKYSKEHVEVIGEGTSFENPKYADAGLPPLARREIFEEPGDSEKIAIGNALSDLVTDGIQPIIKDNNSIDWVKDFVYGDTGMKLDEFIASNGDEFDGLKNLDDSDLKKFMGYIFGDADAELAWNEFLEDRYVSMTQIDISALSGLEGSSELESMINPNMTSIYLVTHVNTNVLGKLYDGNNFGIDSAVKASKLANHLNQVMSNKYVLIPHKTTSTLYVDGVPTFILN